MMPDEEKIVSLVGGPIAVPDGSYPDIVAELERLVEKAKRGEIAAIGMIWVSPGQRPFTNWIAGQGFAHALHSGTASLLFRQTQSTIDPREGQDEVSDNQPA